MFLSTVKKKSPGLFWCLIIFCFLQVVFTLIKLEVTPFFLFGMYSEKINAPDTVSVYQEKLNGYLLNKKKIHKWDLDILHMGIENYNAQLFNNKIDIVDTRIKTKYPGIYNNAVFHSIKKYIMNDSLSLDKFGDWCKQKIYQYTGEKVGTFEVYKEVYKVDIKSGNPQLLFIEKLFHLE
jgi:hypothetical protein